MIQTATVTLKKGPETLKRDLHDEAGIKRGATYQIDSEPWVVAAIHGKERKNGKSNGKSNGKPKSKVKRHR